MTGRDDGAESIAEIRRRATQALTEAARIRGQDGTPIDFSAFLADVLTTTSANVGGTERLLAGRPASRKANCLRSLVGPGNAENNGDLLLARSEPVLLTLNLNEIVQDNYWDTLKRYENARDNIITEEEDCKLDECSSKREEEKIEALAQQYRNAYRAYAASFIENARVAALNLLANAAIRPNEPSVDIDLVYSNGRDQAAPAFARYRTIEHSPRITVIAVVEVEANAWENGVIQNTDPTDDPLAAQLWETAFNNTPPPGVPRKASHATTPRNHDQEKLDQVRAHVETAREQARNALANRHGKP